MYMGIERNNQINTQPARTLPGLIVIGPNSQKAEA